MPQHDIIDNREEKLVNHLNKIFDNSISAKFAVGYFFLSGFDKIKNHLEDIDELKLLIGNTTNRKTIEEISLGYQRRDVIQKIIENKEFSSPSAKNKIAEQTKETLKKSVSYEDQTDKNQNLIVTLARLIEEGRVRVKVYTKEFLHSKAYLFDYKPSKYENGIAVIGSSNLSLSGITSNTELNVVVQGNENYEKLLKWYQELWEEAVDFDESLVNVLKNSWAMKKVSPYDIYMKTLWKLVEKKLQSEKDVPIVWQEDYPKLTEFQRIAVKQAIRIINQHNGVFIADVVGLGKTYIGTALLKHFQENERLRPLIICPPSLFEMWEEFCETYRIDAQILSSGKLSTENIDLENNFRYKNRDIVLLDESHNYRYSDTMRYKTLQPYLSTRKSILMTATPRNNRAIDIYNQMKLFINENQNNLYIETPTLREFFADVENGKRDLRGVLGQVLIRRTRKHILKYYSEIDEKGKYFIRVGNKKNYFPKRILETVTYSIDETYNGLYGEIYEHLESLTYAKYGLFYYVKEEMQTCDPYRNLHQVGKNLRGLMRTLLFKRFESSVHAFRETVGRLIKLQEFFLSELNKKIIAAGEKVSKLIYDSDVEEEIHILHEIEKLSEKYDYNAFNVKQLSADINIDLGRLKKIYSYVNTITPEEDDKLIRLTRILDEIDGERKILIFTQYSDTSKYLYKNLKEKFKNLTEISSETKNINSVVRKFAPKANNYKLAKKEKEIRILISTDVLSEGLNLQDCDLIINYDLHWNPVRLIQRMGRIDRIGAISDKILALNFLPERKLEEKLKLREKLRERINEIHRTIGEDSKILEKDEDINEEAMYAIYQGDNSILDDLETDDELNFTEIEEIIRELEESQPDYFEYIKNLPDGIRSAMITKNRTIKNFILFEHGKNLDLILTNKTGKKVIEKNIFKILNNIRCEKGTKRETLPKNYNSTIHNARKNLSVNLQQITASQKNKGNLSNPIQKYLQREFLTIYSDVDSTEIKENVEIFTKLLTKNLPEIAVKEIKKLKQTHVTGNELLRDFSLIFGKYKLNHYLDSKRKIETNIVKIVCSESLL